MRNHTPSQGGTHNLTSVLSSAVIMVGACKDKVVVEDGKMVVRPILKITATIDHRFLDGAQGSQLANELRKSLTAPQEYLERHTVPAVE